MIHTLIYRLYIDYPGWFSIYTHAIATHLAFIDITNIWSFHAEAESYSYIQFNHVSMHQLEYGIAVSGRFCRI